MSAMKFIRGTTPSIEMTVKSEIDLHQVTEVWVYIYQQKTIKVNKELDDVTFDYENRKMFVRLTQNDTLGLKAGDALFQIRALLQDNTALATEAVEIEISEAYKDGVITPFVPEEETSG